jgi:endoglucanase
MPPSLSSAVRDEHHRWLLEVTQIPTAAGREQRVIEWIQRWVKQRPSLALATDRSGNMTVSIRDARATDLAPVYFTAHLDHPAFVIERIVSPSCVELSFRGGVMDDYFKNAKVAIHSTTHTRHVAVLTGETPAPAREGVGTPPFKHYLAELTNPNDTTKGLSLGDVAVWDLPLARIENGSIYTQACDDLAALVAALAAFDVIAGKKETARDVRLLFTRAEEVGFIGAIAACRDGTIPKSATVIALENSRSFPHDSPIGGGPIVRVGDRMTIFSPTLSESIAKCAEALAGGPATPTASQKTDKARQWKWQRKLMSGGACEASVFCAAGYDATCVCLPLGNYHNMGDLQAIQDGTATRPATIEPEFVSVSDFDGLVDLLIACGQDPRLNSKDSPNPLGPGLRPVGAVPALVEKLWNERAYVLG